MPNNTDRIFTELAHRIMFEGIKESKLLENFAYKEGKNLSDVKKAVRQGIIFKDSMRRYDIKTEIAAKHLEEILIVA